MTKPKSLFPVLTQAQLIKLLTPKQKAFMESLKAEGATFNIQNINQRPYIMNIVRVRNYSRGYRQQQDYDESDYDRMNIEDTQAGFW